MTLPYYDLGLLLIYFGFQAFVWTTVFSRSIYFSHSVLLSLSFMEHYFLNPFNLSSIRPSN